MQKIGELVSSMDIEPSYVLGFFHLLTSLNEIQLRSKGEKLSYNYVDPQNLLNVAMNTRAHSGEHLVRQGLRHATDEVTPHVYTGHMTLCQ
jgi:hypothetical protein